MNLKLKRYILFLLILFVIGVARYLVVKQVKLGEERASLNIGNYYKCNMKSQIQEDNTYVLQGQTPVGVKITKYENHDEKIDEVFINSFEGWKVSYKPSDTHQEYMTIYKTFDSGETWSEVSNSYGFSEMIPTETKEGITFIDSNIGWIVTISPKEGYVGVYKTLDGGKGWKIESLDIPSEYSRSIFNIIPPVFFSDKDGILFTIQSDLEQLVFETHDCGNNWTRITDNQSNGEFKWKFRREYDSKLYFQIEYLGAIWESNNGFAWEKIK